MRVGSGGRTHLQIEDRFLAKVAGDPEVGLGIFASVVRVGQGTRLPRLPALWVEEEMAFARQSDPLDHLSNKQKRNRYSLVEALADKATDVLDDQESMDQVLRMTENLVRKRYPNLRLSAKCVAPRLFDEFNPGPCGRWQWRSVLRHMVVVQPTYQGNNASSNPQSPCGAHV